MDDILEFLKQHPATSFRGKDGDASEKLFGDTQMPDAGPKPPSALERVAALQLERSEIEKNLPPETQKQLDDRRIAMSSATTADERAKIKQQINAIDPAFARISADISANLALAQIEPLDAQPTASAPRRPAPIMRMSTIMCHQPPSQQERSFDPWALNSFFRKERISAIEHQSDNWYSPFTEEFRVAKEDMLQVDCSRRNGELTARLYIPIRGDQKQYLPIERDKPIAGQVDQFVEQKLKELEKRFNVSFSRANQPVMKPFYNDGSGKYLEGSTELLGRQPTLNELAGVEAALELSRCTLDGPRLKVNFLSKPTVDGEAHAGEYWQDIKGSPTIMIFSQEIPAGLKLTDDMHRSWQSFMKETLLHEIAHHNQRKYSFETNTDLIQSLGWTKSQGKENCWLMRGKQPEEFYKFEPKPRTWSACNNKGETAGPSFTSAEMREKALVKPATDYFDTPTEMYAEALAHFRAGGFRRAVLTKNAQLYETIKRYDQIDIDDHQKRDHNGRDGGVLRLPNGRVVASTAENQQTVKDFETLFATTPELPERASEAIQSFVAARQLAFEKGLNSPELDSRLNELSQRVLSVQPELDKFRQQVKGIETHASPASPPPGEGELDAYESGMADLKAETSTLIASHLLSTGRTQEAKDLLHLAAGEGNVRALNLEGSSFGDEQLVEFGNLKGVTSLHLADMPITSKSLATISRFKDLSTLSLRNNNHLDASFFKGLKDLPALAEIEFALPNATDSDLAQLKDIKSLRTLIVENVGGKLTPEGFQWVRDSALTTLAISGIKDGDQLMSQLSGQPTVSRLALADTKLTADGLSRIKSLPHLDHLLLMGAMDELNADNLTALASMKQLKALTITTSKQLDAGQLEALRKQMPDCVITTQISP